MDAAARIRELTETIPDFPKPGIVFRDLTPAFADAEALRLTVDELGARFDGAFDVVAGIEARGFLLASALAYSTRTRLLAVRKAGKLPGTVLTEEYALEYGTASLEIKPDSLPERARVLIVDDVLATGGSCLAAARLVERAGASVAGVAIVMELTGLGGRKALSAYDLETLVDAPA